MTEGEMVGMHHCLNGHEFEQAPGDGDRQGSLEWCSPWGRKELDTTEQQQQQQHLPRGNEYVSSLLSHLCLLLS